MDKRLEILWDGRVPGLSEHRLSLDAFGKALQQLLIAYRRIASNMLAQADSSKGRLHTFAKLFDLELEQIAEGSSGIVAACVLHSPPGFQHDLFFDGLTTRVADALLTDIEAEARGELRNAAVRNYLRALPDGITGQKYAFIENGSRRELAIGSMRLPEGPTEMPILHERLYAIVGVGFEPGESFVRFKGMEEATIHCEATAQQVAKALELRFGSVYALIVKQSGRKARLLRIRRAGEELSPLTPEQEEHAVFGKWDDLLRRLAK
ncbi:MAG TPA: hypothetical protein VGS07_26990 [Thermoanaerobaculia bacterium]|jgi:hypothetical protein|nr:hypothetical protein [Thermoanaerobaculia bacterium]